MCVYSIYLVYKLYVKYNQLKLMLKLLYTSYLCLPQVCGIFVPDHKPELNALSITRSTALESYTSLMTCTKRSTALYPPLTLFTHLDLALADLVMWAHFWPTGMEFTCFYTVFFLFPFCFSSHTWLWVNNLIREHNSAPPPLV